MTELRYISWYGEEGEPYAKACADAADEIERLRAVIDATDSLHSPRLAHDTCLACDHDWPCPTHLLIYPKEADRG